MKRLALAFAFFTAGALLPACQKQPQLPPNVLLVVVDALRADHLGLYGYGKPTSPRLAELAAKGVLFGRAYSSCSWTNPAVTALLTGAPPRVLRPGSHRFIDRAENTLAEIFRDRGYRTGAVVANPALGPDQGFADGFNSYLGPSGWVKGMERRATAPAEKVTDAAINWLEGKRNKPWFLYVHYMDTHWPYQPPADSLRPFVSGALPGEEQVKVVNEKIHARQYAQEDLAFARNLYDGAIAHVDAEIDRLLKQIEKAGMSRTIVAITSDHGEEFGDHGGVLHAATLYEEMLRVPLLVVAPSQEPGRIDSPVPTRDLGRTLLDLAGAPSARFPGQSLLAGARPQITARLFPSPRARHLAAVIEGQEKLLRTVSGDLQFFNLGEDPLEQLDRATERSERVDHLKQAIPEEGLGNHEAADPAVIERMRALGYDF